MSKPLLVKLAPYPFEKGKKYIIGDILVGFGYIMCFTIIGIPFGIPIILIGKRIISSSRKRG